MENLVVNIEINNVIKRVVAHQRKGVNIYIYYVEEE